MKLLRYISIFCIFAGFIAWGLLVRQINAQGPLTEAVTVDIAKGSSSQKVAEILYNEGVINSPFLFRVLMKCKQADGHLKAGEYLFEKHISMKQVFDKILQGDVLYHKVTIPEGYTVGQTMYLLSTNDYLSGEFEKMPQEGTLLPETYTFQKGEPRLVIIKKAMSAMNEKLDDIWNARAEGLPYRSKTDLLIMASIIEKETAVNDERAKVASVFVNRLRKGMLLQTDPTVIYAITEGKEELNRALTRKDLQIDNPYNTYRYAGLPPTPICNPGEASLWAAAHPETTDFIYFVADGTGGHNFAKTLAEHNRNVANWKKNR